MKSMRSMLLLGTLAFTLTGCNPLDCDFQPDDFAGIEVLNNSKCTRGVSRKTDFFESPKPLGPGKIRQISMFGESVVQIRIDPDGCDGAGQNSKFFDAKAGDTIRI